MTQQDQPDALGDPIDPFEAEEKKLLAEKAAAEKEAAENEGEVDSDATPAETKENKSTTENIEENAPLFNVSQAQEADKSASATLEKDQELSLTENLPNLRSILIGVGWDAPAITGEEDEFDLDVSAFLLAPDGRVREDTDFVFYNNMDTDGGAVRHHGDNRDGEGDGDDEMITVALDQVSFQISSIVFVVTIHESPERAQHFGLVKDAYIRLVDMDTNKELLRFNLTEDADKNDVMILGEVIRDGVEWKFHTIGEMSTGGLYETSKGYGVYVAPT